MTQDELQEALRKFGSPIWDRRLTDDEIKQILRAFEERYGPIPVKGEK